MDTNTERVFLRTCLEHCISKTNQEDRYKCELCNFKVNVQALGAHIRDDRKHKNKYVAFKDDIVIFSLPEPCPAQLDAINQLVETYATRLLDNHQRDLRMKAIRELEFTINEWFPRVAITLRPYGSIVSGFALDTSDVNVELLLENEDESNSAQILQNAVMQMSLEPVKYSDIQKEFDISSPRFCFRYSSPSLGSVRPLIHFGVYSNSSFEAAEILAKYASFDPRVAKLAACFKIWANFCGFDRADRGFWPSHAFHIMVIHFLQSTSPPVLPSLYPLDGSTPSKEDIDSNYQSLINNWTIQNNDTLGQLWIKLLAYYVKDFSNDSVVNVRGLKLTLSAKEWTTCILAVEDPVHQNHNLSRSVGRKELFYNYHYNLVRTYNYFMTPRNRNKCLLDNMTDFVLELRSPLFRTPVNIEDSDEEDNKERGGSEDEFEPDEQRVAGRGGKKTLNFTHHMILAKKFGISFTLRSDFKPTWKHLSASDFFYSLEIHRYPFFKSSSKFCIKCKKIDHFKTDCPAEKLPSLLRVPDLLLSERAERLDKVCTQLYLKERLNSFYELIHIGVLQVLTGFVRKVYPDANLQLFGSSKNGFGAKKCDLDLCMTFEGNETGAGIDQTTVIRQLTDGLRTHSRIISNLQPIPQAKVPVLKLRFKWTKGFEKETFDCDISLYNLLAIHNTRLLSTYCQIDERVSILGFTVKHFFKQCGICDASKGSLSSYAYTLMTLYYLQRCSPPVIPVLQELYDGDSPPEVMVDGYNTWFFSDLDKLAEKWPYYRKNTLSVGNLFYGFLKFYAEIFPFDTLVVCTRRTRDLTKMEKKWTGRRIAIEDPFLLSHNLGQGIESEMARYIKASIILGRNRIGSHPDYLMDQYNSWSEYFFDSSYLHDGPFPKGRGCHLCNRIGHQRANCPERRGKNKGDHDSPKPDKRRSEQESKLNKPVEYNESLVDDDESPSSNNSPYNRMHRQMRRLALKKPQRDNNYAERSPNQNVSYPSISGNINNSPHDRSRPQPERTLYNPYANQNQNQHPQSHHHQQQQPSISPRLQKPPWCAPSFKNDSHLHHTISSNHHNSNHPLNSKLNDPSNYRPQRPRQYISPNFSGSGNRQFQSYNPPRNNNNNNNFHDQSGEYIFRSPEFPELDHQRKRDFNRRR